MERFSRNEQLIGCQSQKKLNNSKVAVFGIGGVGSFAAEALARSGIGNITLIDNDVVSESNINRQLIALSSTLGKDKVLVMADRIKDINPYCDVSAYKLFYQSENDLDLTQFDYIIDAIDTVSSKIKLICDAKEKNIPIISCMGTGNKLDPTKFEVEDIYKTSVCPLAKVMRYELKKNGIKNLKVVYSKEIPKKTAARIPSSISFVPPVAGMILAGEVIKDTIKSDLC